mmetsp:Transcript_11169/g.31203  ORF Transcript_11169/g.31203 Transcript_11169/m.31203 type:complete len:354 (-) Transcript_11169:8-1069(-)
MRTVQSRACCETKKRLRGHYACTSETTRPMTSNEEAARFFQSSRSCSRHPCEHQGHTQRRRTAAPKARGGEVNVFDVVVGRDPVRVLALLSVSLAVLVQDRSGLVHGLLRPVLHALHGVAGPLPGSIHSTLGLILHVLPGLARVVLEIVHVIAASVPGSLHRVGSALDALPQRAREVLHAGLRAVPQGIGALAVLLHGLLAPIERVLDQIRRVVESVPRLIHRRIPRLANAPRGVLHDPPALVPGGLPRLAQPVVRILGLVLHGLLHTIPPVLHALRYVLPAVRGTLHGAPGAVARRLHGVGPRGPLPAGIGPLDGCGGQKQHEEGRGTSHGCKARVGGVVDPPRLDPLVRSA